MKIEIDNLIGVGNYAKQNNVSTAYIYKIIKEEKLPSIKIDEVFFIDKSEYPNLDSIKKK